MNRRKILLFLIITFSVTWSCWWVLSAIKQDASHIFSNPLYFSLLFIGGIAPTIAPYVAIKLTDRHYKSFNRSVIKWRINVKFYLMSIVMIIGVPYLAIFIYGYLYEPVWADLSPQFIALIPLTIIMIPLGGLEELGWRGFLLPELTKKINFQIAGFIVGVIWFFWHLPLFFIQGLGHYQSDFLEFAIQTVGLGLVLAWLFGRTKSIFICVLFHAFFNASSSIDLACPDDGKYITAFIWLILGLSLIILDRRKLSISDG